MKIVQYPERAAWQQLLTRPAIDNSSLQQKVKEVMAEVKLQGDTAVKKFTRQFDGVDLADWVVSEKEIREAASLLSDELKRAISQAAENIELFHQKQTAAVEVIETMPGIQCWRRSIGIEKVGLYIPGGTAPLFSTILMLAIPARIAGCKKVVLCSPPGKDGKLNPAIVYAASITGITSMYKIGGVQAIAAMAYGTDTVPQVYKIFGPGNQYVTCAKQLVQQEGIAIDMPAGPSEVCVLADDTADAAFVAADLLSQAEHGVDSQVLLVTTSAVLIEQVQAELERQLAQLSRKELAAKALDNSTAILVKNKEEALALVNEYAAEHLIISCKDADELAAQVVNAGSVFIGNYSPESVGDYASGTNHTLPTNGFAKAYSGVSVDSFVKKVTYQKLSQQGLQHIAETVVLMAEAEGLDAHANAVRVRLNKG
ncbi:MAG: histidinol dehydrogenase [Chitinophagaceae bacterium]|nr:histidinol dehydrogenase [Chitinophagaceae bacterium]MCA6452339.1 histidinol dehydrogenase [Chitinophagaceae bacterium]MCA6454505.1 histidinol dehydrogenase [Chitinophagaceae bacterium]MCA6459244.1 histidinol dehydrogenase [Chitinophagaceae bacterium]MCA6464614.1 histidinol dehydrogenase [Chitinophagaceae bacterium]